MSRQYFKQNLDKFEFFELCVSDVVLVKASGVTYTITAKEFRKSPEDPIALYSKSLIEETNTKYEKELQLVWKDHSGREMEDAFVLGVDRRGFDMMGKEVGGEGEWLEMRMPWEEPILNVDDFRMSINEILKDLSSNNK
eukprot:TRINITY_DN5006_c0_g1_i16.p1 TRINITY_DN5006_c0_g1~~TRINITY_DN5006_c0_g1_i16.p1  ORF type:complete len:139 (+),score=34.03 TRINITY_DN5006_c0_g1_i16:480-896(+)